MFSVPRVTIPIGLLLVSHWNSLEFRPGFCGSAQLAAQVSVGLQQDPFWCSATPALEVSGEAVR